MTISRIGFIVATWILVTGTVVLMAGTDVYMEPDTFIEETFEGEPEQKTLWLDKDLKTEMERILGRPYRGLRIRYWSINDRTAWILEEIGKVELITAGFVVEDGTMTNMRVLIYRESHGWEVRYPFFTRQFRGLARRASGGLNKQIDGISGATLSVNALVRLSEIALLLHKEAQE